MLEQIKKQIKDSLKQAGVKGEIEIVIPPNPEMGDLAFGCFNLTKEKGKKPNEVAGGLKLKVESLSRAESRDKKLKVIEKVETAGPYVNFYLNASELANLVLKEIDGNYGKSKIGKGKKIMVEFAHPNTHKAFHIGHLRNIITGESIVRILENAGYKVVRANYQGDVGMHIAKCLWGFGSKKLKVESIKSETADEKAKVLGEAYAYGSKEFEESEHTREEIMDLNEKIYNKDPEILELYEETRKWSLEYFDNIYKRLGSKFDRLYFESEVFERGKEIVLEFLQKGVFKKSEGAIIFEGEKHGLHDRVFVNSKGFATYEGKDMALAEMQFKEYKPDKILHVVGKEQGEYFKVVFKALEQIFPDSKGKEEHLAYGWVYLKQGKMSSRTGEVILAERLLDEVEKKVKEIMKKSKLKNKAEVVEKVSLAAVKYAILKIGVGSDMAFDINESVSLSGDSGPYLLYICARIRSILRKLKVESKKLKVGDIVIKPVEKHLLLQMSKFSGVCELAVEEYDPSVIAKYLFELAQVFNNFYQNCPVLKAEDDVKAFRLQLIQSVEKVMERGLELLGIETVGEM